MSRIEQKYMGLWALGILLLIGLVIGFWVWQVTKTAQAQTSSPVVESQ
ncbi:hypothetical protein KW798_03435 [Candidatus Parcubacteria bacterium]|nr:hypothetical protein [Candidatus Parcubacteria bacterium]